MVLYPLSKQQRLIITEWLSKKDRPLLINGLTGTGKSKLGKELLKDYHIIDISNEYLKYKGDLIEHIKSSLFKKDILMMCSNIHYKSLLIDDFHYFIKYDKTNASRLIDFIKTVHNNHPIIVITNEIDHKLYDKIKEISYNIKCRYSKTLGRRIFKDKLSDKKYNSTNNLHSLNPYLYGLYSDMDKEYSLNSIMDKLLYEKNTITDKFILCSSDYNILCLNFLENIGKLLRNYNNLFDIYKSICISDMLETKYIDNSIPYEIYILYSCILPSYYIMKNRNYKRILFDYNKYISRSLIQIHNQSLLSSFNYLELIYLLNSNKLSDKKQQIISMINDREYNINTLFKQIKVYNYFYNTNISKKNITQTLKNISS